MAVSIIYLDEHGQRVAVRVADIVYKLAYIGYRLFHNDYWIMHPSENTLLFECGSDKRGFIKYPEWNKSITFYVRFRGFKKSRWCNPDYPEKNTIYISPEENGLKQSEYYSLCYRQAEEKIRALAKLASVSESSYIAIDFSDFRKCFSKAFFADAFTVDMPDISHLAEAVNETVARLNKKCKGSEEYSALIYFQLPEDVKEGDFKKAMDSIKSSAANLKFKAGLGFNDNGGTAISITAAIAYRHPRCKNHIDTEA